MHAMPKVAPWRLAILAKITRGLAICGKIFKLDVQKCMQWRNWRKITSLWRFELDAKSGPLEAGDFGENGDFGKIGDFGKNHQRAGEMWQNIQIGCPEMHAMAKMAKLVKNHQPLAI